MKKATQKLLLTSLFSRLTTDSCLSLFLFCCIFPSTAFSAWAPIVGIPEPPWGINETATTLPASWASNVPGFYFVQAGGTNYNNGYPGNPRPDMPSSPPPGSVICLNGEITQAPTIGYIGTAESPIFIRSYNNESRAALMTVWTFYNAAYVVLENVNTNWVEYGGIELYKSHHISIRNNDLKGNSVNTGGIILQDYYLTDYGQQHHIVINNNIMHEFGDWQTEVDQDKHGVSSADKYTEDVWITNNTFYHLSGDAVQIGKLAYNPSVATRKYYVGANTAYEIKQVAFWTKGAGDVIFSSNIVHNLRNDNPSGEAFGLGMQCGPENVWFINNIVYSCIGGITIAGDQGGVGKNVYVLGNVFYQIHDTTNTKTDWNNPENGTGACFMNRGGKNLYFQNNTCNDYDSGWQLGTGNSTVISKFSNNILSARNTGKPGHSFLSYEADTILLEFRNNIIQGVSANIGGQIYSTISGLQTYLGSRGSNNIDDSPAYVNAAGGNFSLQSGSPAVDAGISPDVYATFQARYGLDISKDINGTTRPQNSKWDIGAYEFSEKTILPIPAIIHTNIVK